MELRISRALFRLMALFRIFLIFGSKAVPYSIVKYFLENSSSSRLLFDIDAFRFSRYLNFLKSRAFSCIIKIQPANFFNNIYILGKNKIFMKHTFKITILMIFIFFAAQVIGLAITSKYIHVEERIDPETNIAVKEIVSEDLPYDIKRPQMEQSYSYLWILLSVLIGTALLLILIKFRRIGLWKIW